MASRFGEYEIKTSSNVGMLDAYLNYVICDCFLRDTTAIRMLEEFSSVTGITGEVLLVGDYYTTITLDGSDCTPPVNESAAEEIKEFIERQEYISQYESSTPEEQLAIEIAEKNSGKYIIGKKYTDNRGISDEQFWDGATPEVGVIFPRLGKVIIHEAAI